MFKNHFIHLTQFAPGRDKKQWKRDLVIAATRTVKDICPDRATKNLIQKETERTASPRQLWLRETACNWLKCLKWFDGHKIRIEQEELHPGHAIEVAHQIFLDSAGSFENFVKHLRRSRNQTVHKLVCAYEELRELRERIFDDFIDIEMARQVFGCCFL